ncbi:MATE family efflux transporter [Lachnoclostridium phytofermentans]|uniref:Probable multidrug resistance protein NorM n=1 Tax=Lachnoclostridium phytofermentans (strain ATCC 700394 / DSM 18823 / ISDg) TaxID=357809 RepID=A9KIH6_LACP7|nr:MATE family efflux transporter [Lachnoclostridium phytofermentans]ABX42428.1 MATE efflux family protein [Lachnoclostridium phytofermentans ISDg]
MENETTMEQNKMGVMKENKLLITMSLPIMVSMLVQAMYNVVDSLFVARLNEDALTAVSLAFPIQNLIIAIGVGTAVGINSLLSRYLGERNQEKVNKVANNGVFITAVSYIFFLIFGLFFTRIFFTTQTDNQQIIEYGVSYLSICTIFSFGVLGQITFERLLQSTGRTVYSMYSQAAGAIINIILDPILIFGLLGAPKLGVAGAAIATVIGQICGFSIGVYLNHKFNHDIHLNIKKFKPDGHIIRQIYQVGFPAIIMQSIVSVMIFVLNKILISFSSTSAAVLGIYSKLQSFVFMPVFGLNNGMIPIIAYNYGAKMPKRIVKIIKLSFVYAIGIMLVGFVLMEIAPREFLSFFQASEDMMGIGVVALRVISISFLFAGFNIVSSSVYQALGNGVLSLVISIIRQLVVLLPVAYILSKQGIHAIWWAFPIAELVAVVLNLIFLKYVYKKEIKPLQFVK